MWIVDFWLLCLGIVLELIDRTPLDEKETFQ